MEQATKRCTICGGAGPFRPQRRQCEPCRLAYVRRWNKERKMKQRPTALTLSSGWVEENIAPISIRIARAEFLSNPPHLQEQRRERVRLLLLAEARRRQNIHSYLWQHAQEIYGI